MATLARGGRLNIFGFVLRLAARLPFLFIAGRIYGAGALGRFAYAVLVVEFAAQLAALGPAARARPAARQRQEAAGLRRRRRHAGRGDRVGDRHGDPDRLSRRRCIPTTAGPRAWTGCSRSPCWRSAWTDIALAALAYHHDVGATVRARSIVEPWTISIVAFAWSYHLDCDDGLIVSYVFSMVAALIAALIPLVRCYGIPHGWKPDLAHGLANGSPQRAAGRRRHGRMGVAAHRPGGARRVHARELRRHLLCRAAGRDPAGQAEDQLRAGARPGDRAQDRGRRPGGGRQAGAPGDLLDHRRAGRDCARARRFPGAR